MSLRSLGVLGAAGVLVLSGCSGNDDKPSDPTEESTSAATLDEAWTAVGPDHMFEPTGDGEGTPAWIHDNTLAVIGSDQIAGIDSTTGEKRWQLPLPGEVLASSYRVNDDGSGGSTPTTPNAPKISAPWSSTPGSASPARPAARSWSTTC